MQVKRSNLDLDNIYTYHAPVPGQLERYVTLRENAKAMAQLIIDNCPETRERSIALTKMEEVIMWANASIARSGE